MNTPLKGLHRFHVNIKPMPTHSAPWTSVSPPLFAVRCREQQSPNPTSPGKLLPVYFDDLDPFFLVLPGFFTPPEEPNRLGRLVLGNRSASSDKCLGLKILPIVAGLRILWLRGLVLAWHSPSLRLGDFLRGAASWRFNFLCSSSNSSSSLLLKTRVLRRILIKNRGV